MRIRNSGSPYIYIYNVLICFSFSSYIMCLSILFISTCAGASAQSARAASRAFRPRRWCGARRTTCTTWSASRARTAAASSTRATSSTSWTTGSSSARADYETYRARGERFVCLCHLSLPNDDETHEWEVELLFTHLTRFYPHGRWVFCSCLIDSLIPAP